jgi:hypothetical protein
MYAQFLKSGVLSLALLLANGTAQSVFAQHHHGGSGHGGGGHIGHGGGGYGGGHYGGSHHYHNGGGYSLGGSGFSLSIGNGYNGFQYSSGPQYGNSYYNSYPSYGYSNYGSGYGYGGSSVYVTPQYVTPTYVTPRYITAPPSAPSTSIEYRTPSVQPSTRSYIPPQDSGPQTNLPSVSFGGRAHIPELASAVADRANQLCLALHDSYLGNPQFKEVYRDTYSLITRAQQFVPSNGATDTQSQLASLTEMNAILAQATPVIESWTPARGASASATSHLNSLQVALKLLSIDAGWSENQVSRTPAALESAPAPFRVAPAPDSLPSENEPTPLDPLPTP